MNLGISKCARSVALFFGSASAFSHEAALKICAKYSGGLEMHKFFVYGTTDVSGGTIWMLSSWTKLSCANTLNILGHSTVLSN